MEPSFFRSLKFKISAVLSAALILGLVLFVYLFNEGHYKLSEGYRKQYLTGLSDQFNRASQDIFVEMDEFFQMASQSNLISSDKLKTWVNHSPKILAAFKGDLNSSELFLSYEVENVLELKKTLRKLIKKKPISFEGFSFISPVQIRSLHENINGMIWRFDSEEGYYYIISRHREYDYWIKSVELVGCGYIISLNNNEVFLHTSDVRNYSFQKEVTYHFDDEVNPEKLSKLISEINFKDAKRYYSYSKYLYQEKPVFNVFIHRNKTNSFQLLINFSWFRIFLFFCVYVLLLLFVMFFLRKYFSRLNRLLAYSKRIKDGDSDSYVHFDSKDELTFLNENLQAIVEHVEQREYTLRKSERKTREAKDQAEQALVSKSQLLENIRVQKQEIERVSKDKDDLMAIVSHDLKNPLAVIETSLDILLEESSEMDDKLNELIKRSQSSAQMALNLITDLLDLSRLEGGITLDFERFNVSELINRTIDNYYYASNNKKIKITTEVDDEIEIIADYGRMSQVLNNILGNAVKFTQDEGHVDIKITKINSEPSVDGALDNIEIRFSDDGPGIARDKLDIIFDKYSQARKSDRSIGTGLGLTICKNICELHNGSIKVESDLGHGATFIITLPRLVDKKIKGEGVENIYTLLLVNDDEAIRKDFSKELTKLNYQVMEAKNGLEMFKLLDRHSKSINLILLDEEMPVMDGQQALSEMLQNQEYSSIPIIFMQKKSASMRQLTPEVRSIITDLVPIDISIEKLNARITSIISPQLMASNQHIVDSNFKSIVVLDEEQAIRALLVEEFKNLQFNCFPAKNIHEARFLLKKYKIDLFISDHRALDRHVQEERSLLEGPLSVPTLILSSSVESLNEQISERYKAIKVFNKPFNIVECCNFSSEFLEGPINKNNDQIIVNDLKRKNERTRLMVVDDSQDMLVLFKTLLRKSDVDISLFDKPEDALDIFTKERFDYIFVDFNMPQMNGDEFVKHIRSQEGEQSQTMVIFFSATNLKLERPDLFGENCLFIEKPINKKKILAIINL